MSEEKKHDVEFSFPVHRNQSASIGNLAAALAKVQAKLKSAKMDAVNPFFKSKYATLESCWAACRDLLSANELAIIQTPSSNGGDRTEVKTILAHSSGEWISGTVSLKPKNDDPQGAGSAISYARRYGLCCLVGVVSGEGEDDGEAATRPPPNTQSPKQPPRENPQQKADAEASPIVQLWIKAERAAVPQEEWKLWLKEYAITKDKRTQGTKKMELLEKKIEEWEANSREEGGKLFVSEDEIAWLRSTAEASAIDIQGEEGLLKFVQATIGDFNRTSLKTLTKQEFDLVMTEINQRSADAGDLP